MTVDDKMDLALRGSGLAFRSVQHSLPDQPIVRYL